MRTGAFKQLFSHAGLSAAFDVFLGSHGLRGGVRIISLHMNMVMNCDIVSRTGPMESVQAAQPPCMLGFFIVKANRNRT